MTGRLVIMIWGNEDGRWGYYVKAPIAFQSESEAETISEGRDFRTFEAANKEVQLVVALRRDEIRKANIAHKAQQSADLLERSKLGMSRKEFNRHKASQKVTR